MLQTDRFKARLQAERERLCRQIGWAENELVTQDSMEYRSVVEAMPESGDDDIAEAATSTYTQELEEALVRRARNRLNTIDAALQRIQVGQYGSCVHCGREIAIGRLEALPWAMYCVECAQELEVLD